MDGKNLAYWLADKIVAYDDYTKQAADVLRKQADAIEHGQAHIYAAEAEQITRPLRELLKRTLPMVSGAGCGTLASEICKAIGVPNLK